MPASLFRSALSRGERRQLGRVLLEESRVSIRALAWRATGLHFLGELRPQVSIRALAWRATRYPARMAATERVSIRALAWRATADLAAISARLDCFDPRSRVESDQPPRPSPPTACCFDPRSRVESDKVMPRASAQAGRFRSALSRGERRRAFGAPTGREVVSIRALAWRATVRSFPHQAVLGVSIRALAWRATEAVPGGMRITNCFDPRSRVESDAAPEAYSSIVRFRSALSRGERPCSVMRPK